jgi:glycosyltransferase involved in cell wall biosynthesis
VIAKMNSGKSKPPDIAVIITAHSEGRLMHRSARSAERAIRYAEGKGIETELIAVLDCARPQTLDYVNEWGKIFQQVVVTEFGDPGLARNHGVQLASGRYVAFLTAGDLFSESWLAAAFQLSEKLSGCDLVLHPQFNVFFGVNEFCVEESFDSDLPDYSPLELLQFNPWRSSGFVSRKFFLNGNHYGPLTPGYGNEEWHWNCEVIANGGVHRLVPGTAHFVRLSRDRETRIEQTFRPSKLFESCAPNSLRLESGRASLDAESEDVAAGDIPATVDEANFAPSSQSPLSLARRGRNTALTILRPWPRLLNLGVEINSAIRKARFPFVEEQPRPLPHPLADCEWLLQEWIGIHEVDTDLFPRRAVMDKVERRKVSRSAIAQHYSQFDALMGSPTHVFLLPCLTRGGADAEAIIFMKTVLKQEHGSRITCILTEDCESSWLSRLPKEIAVIELRNFLRGFSENDKASLLLRLLIQKKPRVIHNINCALGYKLFRESGPALSVESELFVSLFGFEFLPEGDLGGYAVWDLPDCIDNITRVLTDSHTFGQRLRDLYGFPAAKFCVAYVPVPGVSQKRKAKTVSGMLNVLWASRVCREKRPDVLFEIASRLIDEPFVFHVYGGDISDPAIQIIFDRLSELPNVKTYGPYDGFGSLPLDDYDVFLYTSERDGLPNVLLEAAAAELPVIAPDVGGVKEIINDTTGFLVSGPEGIDEYVGYLREIQADYQIAAARSKAARSLIETRHSSEAFVSVIENLPGYLKK